MGKNASFKGDISGTIENQVNDWDNQSISGNKTFTAAITSSADVMLSGSGKVSASFFYGDGSGLSGVAAAAGAIREVQFNNGGSALGASSTFTFTAANQLQVTGQISASLGVSGSEFHGDGSNLTAVTASFVTASNVVGVFDTSKITTGTFADARIPNLDTVKITTGTFAVTRISEASVTQYSASLDIAGGQLTGDQSIQNARLQDTVSVVNVTASGHMSASTFHGNGAALTGVSATATPAGTNADIQFNADGVLGSSNRIQFNTGSFTLTATNLSSSGNISGSSLYLQDEIIVGGQTFVNSEGNVAAGNGSFVEITASSTISSSADVYGAAFIGDGRQLSGAPINTAVANAVVTVVNATDKTITSNTNFKYDGSDVIVTSGDVKATNLSASADVHVGGNIISDTGDLDVNTAKAKRFKLLSVGDEDTLLDLTSGSYAGTGFSTISMFNSASNALRETVTITSDTLGVGPFFRLQTNAASPIVQVQMWQGQISASADLQVGGHITGSGDVVLGGTMYWDRTGTGNTTGPKLTPGGSPANSLNIDGDSIITIQADTNARFRVGNASTPDLILDITPTVVSSSVPITGSALHTNSGITIATGGGDLTFLSDQGKVTAGSIEMVAGGSDVLNFNDNSISGSGNISGSAFYGDGSNLTNLPTRNLVSYQSRIFLSNSTERFFCFAGSTTAQAAPGSDQQRAETTFIAPASGTLRQISITTFGASAGNTSVIAACYKNGDYTSVITHTTGALEPGGGDGGRQLPVLSNNFTNTFDMTSGSIGTPLAPGAGNVFVSGTVPFDFDPNDSLHFGFKFADGNNLIYGSINLLFELDSTDIP